MAVHKTLKEMVAAPAYEKPATTIPTIPVMTPPADKSITLDAVEYDVQVLGASAKAYIVSMPVWAYVKGGFVDPYMVGNGEPAHGVQRDSLLTQRHAQSYARYIAETGNVLRMPHATVRGKLKVARDKLGNVSVTVPTEPRSFSVDDGGHLKYALGMNLYDTEHWPTRVAQLPPIEFRRKLEATRIPVVLYADLTEAQEASIFYTINANALPIRKSLEMRLDREYDLGLEDERTRAAGRVVEILNREGFFKDRIRPPNVKADPKYLLEEATLVAAIRNQSVFTSLEDDEVADIFNTFIDGVRATETGKVVEDRLMKKADTMFKSSAILALAEICASVYLKCITAKGKWSAENVTALLNQSEVFGKDTDAFFRGEVDRVLTKERHMKCYKKPPGLFGGLGGAGGAKRIVAAATKDIASPPWPGTAAKPRKVGRPHKSETAQANPDTELGECIRIIDELEARAKSGSSDPRKTAAFTKLAEWVGVTTSVNTKLEDVLARAKLQVMKLQEKAA